MSSAALRGTALACLALAILGCRRPEIARPAPVVAPSIRLAVLPFRVNGYLDAQGTYRGADDPGDMDDVLGEGVGQRLTNELRALGVSMIPLGQVLRATPQPGAAIYDVDLAARVGAKVVTGCVGWRRSQAKESTRPARATS